MTKQNKASGFSFVFLVLVIVVCLSWLWQADTRGTQLDYAQVYQLFQQERVESFTLDANNTLTMNLTDELNGSKTVRYRLHDFQLFYDQLDDLVKEQSAKGIIKSYDYPPPETTNWLEVLLPWVLTAVVLALMWYFMIARTQGGMGADRMAKFGAARTRMLTDKDKKVTFEDVAGADEEKEELQEIVEFLKDPKKYIALGARIPKGVLLVGPPGTGKTLLAKAACCWWALRAPVRRCLPRRWPARRA